MKKNKIILPIILICLFLFGIYGLFFSVDRTCLKEIAEDYCKSKDLEYNGINIAPVVFFFCHVEDDVHDSKRFSFTLEEKESCERIKLRRGRF